VTNNEEWRFFRRNQEGRAAFIAQLRYQSLMWINHTTLFLPCWTKKSAPAVVKKKE
jgi:hypothetical protein